LMGKLKGKLPVIDCLSVDGSMILKWILRNRMYGC
jgi:hypothetical protein